MIRRAAVVAGAAAVFLLGLILGARRPRAGIENPRSGASAVLAPTAKTDRLLHDFWLSLLGNDHAPVVAYANPVYLLDGANDLLTFTHGATANRGAPVDPHLAREFAANPAMVGPAGTLFYEDGYTGTGDVQSVFRLTRLFTQMGYGLTVKRCREVTIDDLKDHRIVLLGSSFENSAVAQFPMTGDFVFHIPVPQGGVWKGEILNVHPHPGESASYRTERDPITGVVKADYALMTIQPGIAPGRYALVLGALDTSGVDGVTQFATSEPGIAELSKALASLGERPKPGQPPLFQAILRVDLENGQDVLSVHLVTVHLIRPRS